MNTVPEILCYRKSANSSDTQAALV